METLRNLFWKKIKQLKTQVMKKLFYPGAVLLTITLSLLSTSGNSLKARDAIVLPGISLKSFQEKAAQPKPIVKDQKKKEKEKDKEKDESFLMFINPFIKI